MAKHFAIVPNENNEPVRFPLKSWVRQNMQQLGEYFPREGTTQTFKRHLLRRGWKETSGIDTVFVVKPDRNDSIEYANNYIQELETEVDEDEDENEEAQEMTFGLERDLQQALRRNIQSIEPGLTIIDDGRERRTEAGLIDITAQDTDGRKVIIELKAPIAKPDVIAQTLAYMEAVQNEDQGEVRGIIIASDFVDRVKLAARQIPNLKLIRYGFSFSFNEVN
jgi:RecB family endonuclease NucS